MDGRVGQGIRSKTNLATRLDLYVSGLRVLLLCRSQDGIFMRDIAIICELDTNWIGGSYYLRNLVAALGLLPSEEQPRITILCNKRLTFNFIQETGYPKLFWVKLSDFESDPDRYPFGIVFPHPVANQSKRTISWIPDFQELHLPHYFSAQELQNRRHHHRLRFATAGLVVSSEDVKRDVEAFYPGECENIAVVHFATFDRFERENLPEMIAKYDLPDRYVMCANQVWIHKNHIVVLKALAILKAQNIDVTVCFTGSEQDYRIGGYASTLKSLAVEWNLEQNVRFLGFIPRTDQLTLMYGADYIIQPSLFEGWSTVIEDAKAMGQFVVASDLSVHVEQLTDHFRHFPRHDPQALAGIIKEFAAAPPQKGSGDSYEFARSEFGRDFLDACARFEASPTIDAPVGAAELAQITAANINTVEDDLPAVAVTASHSSPTSPAPISSALSKVYRLGKRLGLSKTP